MTHPTKLTLRLDSGLIESAKAFAHEHQRSLSQLVADYFARLAAQSASATPSKGKALSPITVSELSPVTNSLRGVLKGKSATEFSAKRQLSADPDKAAHRKYLEEKHL